MISESFAEFLMHVWLKPRKYDFNFFVSRDEFYTSNFFYSSVQGKLILETTLKEGKGSVNLGNRKYDLSSRKAVVNFLNEPNISLSFTLLALANSAQNLSLEFFGNTPEEEIYRYYNGYLRVFVDGISNYSTSKVANNTLPSKNDFQDIIHLLYLRHGEEVKIVSDDNFFSKHTPQWATTIVELNAHKSS